MGHKVKKAAQVGPFIFRVIMTEFDSPYDNQVLICLMAVWIRYRVFALALVENLSEESLDLQFRDGVAHRCVNDAVRPRQHRSLFLFGDVIKLRVIFWIIRDLARQNLQARGHQSAAEDALLERAAHAVVDKVEQVVVAPAQPHVDGPLPVAEAGSAGVRPM